jgi:hypothetical protein
MSNPWDRDGGKWPEPTRQEWQEPKWQRHATPPAPPDQRQAPAPPLIAEEPPPSLFFPSDRVYVSYETRARPEGLIFFTAIKPAHGAAYHQLQNFGFDQHHGEFLTLFYPAMRVHIIGQRLAPVIHAVVSYKCAIIREWHRDLYDPPTRGQALIESITVTPLGEESLLNT